MRRYNDINVQVIPLRYYDKADSVTCFKKLKATNDLTDQITDSATNTSFIQEAKLNIMLTLRCLFIMMIIIITTRRTILVRSLLPMLTLFSIGEQMQKQGKIMDRRRRVKPLRKYFLCILTNYEMQ